MLLSNQFLFLEIEILSRYQTGFFAQKLVWGIEIKKLISGQKSISVSEILSCAALVSKLYLHHDIFALLVFCQNIALSSKITFMLIRKSSDLG